LITTEKLKTELIELFNLEGVHAEEISDDDHLFNDGLGLDSVDAIELTILEFLPQKDPVGFVKEVLVCEEHESRVVVRFESVPTLSMLSEAGAQTSIFLRLTEEKKAANVPVRAMGMLVSVKSKWLQKSDKKSFEVESRYAVTLIILTVFSL
jgi:hypothetical protein